MLNRTVRQLVVGILLAAAAVAGVTAASAAGDSGLRHATGGAPTAQRQQLPFISGELGEVVVRAPGYLGEVVVHAPGDIGEVLVRIARLPAAGQLLADVLVSARRVGAANPGAMTAATVRTASL